MKCEIPAFGSVSSRESGADPVPDRGRADVRKPLRDHALAGVELGLGPRLHRRDRTYLRRRGCDCLRGAVAAGPRRRAAGAPTEGEKPRAGSECGEVAAPSPVRRSAAWRAPAFACRNVTSRL